MKKFINFPRVRGSVVLPSTVTQHLDLFINSQILHIFQLFLSPKERKFVMKMEDEVVSFLFNWFFQTKDSLRQHVLSPPPYNYNQFHRGTMSKRMSVFSGQLKTLSQFVIIFFKLRKLSKQSFALFTIFYLENPLQKIFSHALNLLLFSVIQLVKFSFLQFGLIGSSKQCNSKWCHL